jgi:hypothetical protein
MEAHVCRLHWLYVSTIPLWSTLVYLIKATCNVGARWLYPLLNNKRRWTFLLNEKICLVLPVRTSQRGQSCLRNDQLFPHYWILMVSVSYCPFLLCIEYFWYRSDFTIGFSIINRARCMFSTDCSPYRLIVEASVANYWWILTSALTGPTLEP